MQFITSPKTILGLDISDLSLKAAQIDKTGEKKYLKALKMIEVPDGLIIDGEIKNEEKLADIIKKLLKNSGQKFTTKYTALSLPETKTFIKVIEVPGSDLSVEEAIKQELPRHIPIGNEEMLIDWEEAEPGLGKRRFLVGAVARQVADGYIRVAKLAGLEVIALEIEAEAIARCILPAHQKMKAGGQKKMVSAKSTGLADGGPKIIVDFGATRTSLIFLDRGIIRFTNNLPQISGQEITSKIAEALALSNQEAEQAKIICGTNPKKCKGATLKIINETIDELAKEIINADNFYQTHFGQESGQVTVLLCGGGSNMANLDKILQERTGREIAYGNPMANVESPKMAREDLLAYTTAIGLALRNYLENEN